MREESVDAVRTLARLLSVEDPFPWQVELLRRFRDGDVPKALDVPTGLGKTAVMAIWLAARATGASVPRRLIYVVDRRAVVDQSTRVAEQLREHLAEDPALAQAAGLLHGRMLPISTLRGRFVDNREWLEDPASPAIIVGTVDMVGSRLLFQGYGTSRRMRPYQAALLARDSLLVLDESHLVPPFAHLVGDLAASPLLEWGENTQELPSAPRLRCIALSATGRQDHAADEVLRLSETDEQHPVVQRRLEAEKLFRFARIGDGKDAIVAGAVDEATRLLDGEPSRILIFTNRREHAEKIASALSKAERANVELFVGARRIRERSAAADRLTELGFLAGANPMGERHSVLVATSAAEVGVDLDADHMIADVVSWERTVQRLGRVNRR